LSVPARRTQSHRRRPAARPANALSRSGGARKPRREATGGDERRPAKGSAYGTRQPIDVLGCRQALDEEQQREMSEKARHATTSSCPRMVKGQRPHRRRARSLRRRRPPLRWSLSAPASRSSIRLCRDCVEACGFPHGFAVPPAPRSERGGRHRGLAMVASGSGATVRGAVGRLIHGRARVLQDPLRVLLRELRVAARGLLLGQLPRLGRQEREALLGGFDVGADVVLCSCLASCSLRVRGESGVVGGCVVVLLAPLVA
jgi:hypothetical protein